MKGHCGQPARAVVVLLVLLVVAGATQFMKHRKVATTDTLNDDQSVSDERWADPDR